MIKSNLITKSLRWVLFSLSFSKSTLTNYHRLSFLLCLLELHQTSVIYSQIRWINRKDSFNVFILLIYNYRKLVYTKIIQSDGYSYMIMSKLFIKSLPKSHINQVISFLNLSLVWTIFMHYISMKLWCHHLSDNHADLLDFYVGLSVIYVDLSDHYVNLRQIE